MKLKVIVVMALIVSLAAVGGCKKKEDAKPIATPGTEQSAPATAPTAPVASGKKTIIVPDFVKGKWGAVKLTIEDKASKKTNDVVVKLGSEYKVPGSNLKVVVGDFLPAFTMDETTFTSTSNELKNPAVFVTIFEGDKEIFKNWLYSQFPQMHSFTHDKFGITLKEGIKS